MEDNKKKKLRFSTFDDIAVLKETLANNPFEDAARWEIVQRNVHSASEKDFSVRSIKEHLTHLISLFKKEDLANLRKSGTEEQYEEKEQLLQEVASMKDEYQRPRKRRRTISEGEELRELALSTIASESHEMASSFSVLVDDEDLLSPNQDLVGAGGESADGQVSEESSHESSSVNRNTPSAGVLGPSGTRKRRSNPGIVQYLQEKSAKDFELKKEELQLQREKLLFEERKLALEEDKAMFQRQMEEKEQEFRHSQIAKQNETINLLLEMLAKK